jgi:hypothetical protein
MKNTINPQFADMFAKFDNQSIAYKITLCKIIGYDHKNSVKIANTHWCDLMLSVKTKLIKTYMYSV